MENRVIVVGIGPGSPDYLIPAAKRAIDEAKVLIGSKRALETFAPKNCETHAIGADIPEVLSLVRRRLKESDVVVMVSGDPGFYSLLAAIRQQFEPKQILVIPGLSSIQTAYARLAKPWHDAVLVSLHGRHVDEEVLSYKKGKSLAILTDANQKPSVIASTLSRLGWPPGAQVWLCSNLSYDSEQIKLMFLHEALDAENFEHCVMVVECSQDI